MRRVAPAVALFFLSPLVAEFLLGDFGLGALFVLIGLAPMYGGGAIVIREVVRRTGRGWPSIVLLALAYGVLEEGFTTGGTGLRRPPADCSRTPGTASPPGRSSAAARS
jgi:hypothetical protein